MTERKGTRTGKALKPLSSKKPPEATDTHSDIDDWLPRLMPHLQPIVGRLDEVIRETVPGLQYAVKWKRAYYGLPKVGWMIELAPYDVSVNVVFFGGVDLDPPPPLGTNGRSRYVKITSFEEAERPELRTWIKRAARVPGWR